MGRGAEPVTALTAGELDGGQGADVEGPEEAVVDEERVFLNVVEADQNEEDEGEGDALECAFAPERPEAAPCREPAEQEEEEPGQAEFEADFEEAIVGVLDDEMDGSVDLHRRPLHAAPEGVEAVAEERALGDGVEYLGPDGGASGEGGLAIEQVHQLPGEVGGDDGGCGGEDRCSDRDEQ